MLAALVTQDPICIMLSLQYCFVRLLNSYCEVSLCLMYQPTIMLSHRLAPLLGLENPDYGALSMMWGNYEVCITANQHFSLSIMSTDDLRIVVGPAPKIMVEVSLLKIVGESAVMLLYVTKLQINASCWNCTTINSGSGVYWKGCGWDEGYLCWYESVPIVRHSFCRSIACE